MCRTCSGRRSPASSFTSTGGGKRVPVPVLEPEPVKERRWKFEFRPMTQQQQAAASTVTVGGMLLLIAMILLAPVGCEIHSIVIAETAAS
jgi:hypothetical protein